MTTLKNQRHEKFAQELAKGETADAAYVAAGFKENRGNATRLKANESVMKRVDELQGKAAERTGLTIESVTENLLRIARKGEALNEASGLAVARAAHMDAAKINGLIVDRSENVNINHDVSSELPTEDEWAAEHATEH